MLRPLAALAMAACVTASSAAVAQPASKKSETVPIVSDGVRIVVPIAKGHCQLDRNHAVDRQLTGAITGTLDKTFKVAMLTMDCDTLKQIRQKPRENNLEVNTYLTAKTPEGLTVEGKGTFAKLLCDAMAAEASGVVLTAVTPRDKAAELEAIAAKRKSSSIGVLQKTERACYIGQVAAVNTLRQVQALTLVKSRIVAIGALTTGGTAVELLLPRAGHLITETGRINGEE